MDLNTVFDFDLVREKTLTIDSNIISDELVFDTKILADYNESIGNRVLTVELRVVNIYLCPVSDGNILWDSSLRTLTIG